MNDHFWNLLSELLQAIDEDSPIDELRDIASEIRDELDADTD